MAVIAVVKYNGRSDDLVWRFPSEGLGTWTKLIVNDSQEAVLFANRQAMDIFTTGRYELTAGNIPMLSKDLNLSDNDSSALPMSVWYINKEHSLEVKWGTPMPIQMQDPMHNMLISLRALGQFHIQIGDSATLINHLVGKAPVLDNDFLAKHFRSFCLDKLKNNILSFLEAKEMSALEIGAHTEDLSKHLSDEIAPLMNELGVKMSDFRMNQIKLSEESPVVKQIIGAKVNAAPALSDGIPIPMSEPAQTYNDNTRRTCPVCYNDIEATDRYCKECKYDTAPGSPDPKLVEQKEMTPKAASPQNASLEYTGFKSTRKCPNCNVDMNDTARFCFACGCDTSSVIQRTVKPALSQPAPVMEIPLSEREQPNQKTCASCGTKLRDHQLFCHKCGRKP